MTLTDKIHDILCKATLPKPFAVGNRSKPDILQSATALESAHRPKLGDHLISQRLGYTHHGIYIGNGKVIHYAGLANGLESGSIEETTLEKFSNGANYSIKSHASPAFSGQTVVERAYSRLGENQYNVYWNNCEHFCEWCINDQHRSEQIEHAKSSTTNGLVAFTALRAIAPPQVSIPLSVAYSAYCWMQKKQESS